MFASDHLTGRPAIGSVEARDKKAVNSKTLCQPKGLEEGASASQTLFNLVRGQAGQRERTGRASPDVDLHAAELVRYGT
jgi:hypothetical protein